MSLMRAPPVSAYAREVATDPSRTKALARKMARAVELISQSQKIEQARQPSRFALIGDESFAVELDARIGDAARQHRVVLADVARAYDAAQGDELSLAV